MSMVEGLKSVCYTYIYKNNLIQKESWTPDAQKTSMELVTINILVFLLTEVMQESSILPFRCNWVCDLRIACGASKIIEMENVHCLTE